MSSDLPATNSGTQSASSTTAANNTSNSNPNSNANASPAQGSTLNSWKTSVDQKTGEYKRKESQFRHWVLAKGSTSGQSSEFEAEANRYHLYVSLACPWAHRTLVMRELKGLQDVIGVTVVDWLLAEGGWRFCDDKPQCTPDPVNHFNFLRQVYLLSDPNYQGNVTVPVLFDKKTQRIVNNESSEIIRILNSQFNAFCKTKEQAALDFYPESLKAQIDEVNGWVYATINNGVYRCGFATSQEAYERAFDELFASLDRVEGILAKQRYLAGNRFTEADIRLFTTLIRFDAVYYGHFKCNLRRISDYPHLSGYLREIYQMDHLKDTVNLEHIKKHYMVSHRSINPHGIVSKGPLLDFDSPPKRDHLPAEPSH